MTNQNVSGDADADAVSNYDVYLTSGQKFLCCLLIFNGTQMLVWNVIAMTRTNRINIYPRPERCVVTMKMEVVCHADITFPGHFGSKFGDLSRT